MAARRWWQPQRARQPWQDTGHFLRGDAILFGSAGDPDIPDHITVDLAGRDIGDVIHINDVVLPNGAKPTVARNFVIANIGAPTGLMAASEEAAEAWLENQDANREKILAIFRKTYGDEAAANRWFHRWRIFFMACAELFGFDGGNEWGVSHYRFAKPLSGESK